MEMSRGGSGGTDRILIDIGQDAPRLLLLLRLLFNFEWMDTADKDEVGAEFESY